MADPGSDGSIQARVTRLIEKGLVCYGKGNLAEALSEWEHALTLEPGNEQAKQYLQYVRDNFTGLDRAFKQAKQAEEAAAKAGIPTGIDAAAPPLDLEDEYEVEVSGAEPAAPPPTGEEVVDSGWDINEFAAPPLPPPPMTPTHSEAADRTGTYASPALPTADEGFGLSDLEPAPAISTARMSIDLDQQTDDAQTTARLYGQPVPDFPDVGTGEHTMNRLRDTDLVLETEPVREDTGTGERTTTRGFGRAGAADEGSFAGQTRSWGSAVGIARTSGEPSSSVEVDPGLVDDELLLGLTPPPNERPSAKVAAAIAEPRPALDMPEDDATTGMRPTPKPSVEEQHLARAMSFISAAQAASEDGDLRQAADHAEAALNVDPEGRVVQQALHRHKELLLKMFEEHIGDATQIPCIAVSVSEIRPDELDHRTAFLLSRIDGSLTVDEILDIAGMPRFETYRLLSRLVRKGILQFT